MYKDLNECFLHSPDGYADLICEMQMGSCMDSDEAYELYALVTMATNGIFDKVPDWKVRIRIHKGQWGERVSCAESYVMKAIPAVLTVEDKIFLNNVLHCFHTQMKDEIGIDLRKEAIETYADYVYALTGFSLSETIPLTYEGCALTGKSSVPDEWEKAIRREIAAYTDVFIINISMGWSYSHLDCGSDYGYDIPEAINVEIGSYSTEAFDMIQKRLWDLRLVKRDGRFLVNP